MSVKSKVEVNLGERSYEILVGDGIFESAADLIKNVSDTKKYIIITDANIEQQGYLEKLQNNLSNAGVEVASITLEPGEQTKSFSGFEKLLDEILSLKPDRHTKLIALGGGVVGDITGFAASVVLRGIDFVQIPTTLLAMVDSSVGGKTGINSKHGKNLIGSFHQPILVIADTGLLNSLPERELLAGYAEVVKYALIGSEEFLQKLESVPPGKYDADHAAEVIKICCEMKAQIVSEDEKESGKRALLNLGHTFAHALEAETGYSNTLIHGEAVSIGMVLAFKLSNLLNLCAEEDVVRVEAHLGSVGLPTSISDIKGNNFSAENLILHMRQDKKVKDGKIIFILAKGIGEAFVSGGIDEARLAEFIEGQI